MRALLCVVLAVWSVQADEVAALEEQVRALRSRDLYDAAKEAIRAFGVAHPSLAADPRVKDLRTRTEELAGDADRFFRTCMEEARKQVEWERHGEAIRHAERALRIYPERKAQVDELHARVQQALAAKVMVVVPSRPCWIGGDGERPLRQVKLPAFLIDSHPVTNENYSTYLAATGTAPPSHWSGHQIPRGRERHPVVGVPWDRAAAYARWAGKRLPTAEEWEVAARGVDRREYPWGSLFQEKKDQFVCNSVEYWQAHRNRSPGTTAVDELAPRSASGACMGGNVWEWTSTIAPGKIGERPAEFRILKGGSFMTTARALRCAVAFPENPEIAHPDVGFRCAKDAP